MAAHNLASGQLHFMAADGPTLEEQLKPQCLRLAPLGFLLFHIASNLHDALGDACSALKNMKVRGETMHYN